MDHAGHGLLKAWRDSASLSQSKLAERIDVSQSLIAEWEKGPRRPSLETAVVMEAETSGTVAVEAWGYDRSLVTSMASLVDRRRAQGDTLDSTLRPASDASSQDSDRLSRVG